LTRIINGLHHKDLQLQCCRQQPVCLIVYRNLQAAEINKLTIALYVLYIWLIVFILTSYTLS